MLAKDYNYFVHRTSYLTWIYVINISGKKWKTYDSTHLNFSQKDQVSWRINVFYQATWGFIVGTLASLYAHPFDTIMTRLQENHTTKQTTTQIARDLII
jgi:hypothetical protein